MTDSKTSHRRVIPLKMKEKLGKLEDSKIRPEPMQLTDEDGKDVTALGANKGTAEKAIRKMNVSTLVCHSGIDGPIQAALERKQILEAHLDICSGKAAAQVLKRLQLQLLQFDLQTVTLGDLATSMGDSALFDSIEDRPCYMESTARFLALAVYELAVRGSLVMAPHRAQWYLTEEIPASQRQVRAISPRERFRRSSQDWTKKLKYAAVDYLMTTADIDYKSFCYKQPLEGFRDIDVREEVEMGRCVKTSQPFGTAFDTTRGPPDIGIDVFQIARFNAHQEAIIVVNQFQQCLLPVTSKQRHLSVVFHVNAILVQMAKNLGLPHGQLSREDKQLVADMRLHEVKLPPWLTLATGGEIETFETSKAIFIVCDKQGLWIKSGLDNPFYQQYPLRNWAAGFKNGNNDFAQKRVDAYKAAVMYSIDASLQLSISICTSTREMEPLATQLAHQMFQ